MAGQMVPEEIVQLFRIMARTCVCICVCVYAPACAVLCGIIVVFVILLVQPNPAALWQALQGGASRPLRRLVGQSALLQAKPSHTLCPPLKKTQM